MQFPGYSLIRQLSQGGFGAVHLARRERDGAEVALKVLLLPNDANLRRFYREAKLLHEQLANPYVVNLLDSRFDSDPAFIVMEFCVGGSLRSWVGKGREWRQVAFALSHAASGLDGIHQLGGFHRDVKPDNLLLGRDADGKTIVKVGDFGLARVPDSLSSAPMTRSAWGTEGYIAPELHLGAPFDAQCDVYSLGVTGIELLTGARDPGSLEGRADLPADLRRLLLQMVSPDPADRPALRTVLTTLASVTAPPVPRPAPKPAPAPKQPSTGAGLGLLAGLAAVVGGIALATMNNRDANGRWRGDDGRFRSGPWG